MEDTNTIIIFLSCIAAIIVFGKILIWPLKNIIKLVLNSILGGLLIWIINYIGINFGFHIGLNIVTSLFVGILGIPGAILLVIFKLFLN
ncbi:MAG: pro-sigmaK processing inhibitor BofA family protein [Clostridia bacterium]|nr:pro-sigmaK processing inhibitor BofA family protein [Clostridia bacterium]